MISVHNGSSAGGAVHYFSADNYYTQDEGLEHSEWYGEGARELGLSGVIGKEDFARLLDGEVGKQLLGRRVLNEKGESEREHRPYMDVTFSAPKSVSLLAEVAGMKELRQAHEESVKETLGYMERKLAGARVGAGKDVHFEKTGNLTVALFRHNTSRELDPQTHTHAVIMNATKAADGKWRSLTNDPIYDQQHTIGAIYTSTLARKVKELGMDIEVKDQYGNFEIKGVSDQALEHFSQRRTQIKDALAERGIDIGTASAELREKATLMTRKSKKEVDHEQLLADWKERAESVGLELGNIVKCARERQEKEGGEREAPGTGADTTPERPGGRQVDPSPRGESLPPMGDGRENAPAQISPGATPGAPSYLPSDARGMPGDGGKAPAGQTERPQEAERPKDEGASGAQAPGDPEGAGKKSESPAIDALRFAAAHLHEREMVVPTDLLLRTATQHSVGKASFLEIEAAYDRLVSQGVLHEVSGERVTTNRLLRSEEWLVQSIHEGKGRVDVVLAPEAIQRRIHEYEQQEGARLSSPNFALTPGQREAVTLALSAEDRYVAVQGDAGTGKTTMLQAVRVMAEENGYHVRGMSVSGSAAGTLEVETGIQSHTVKMFMINEQRAQKEIEALRDAGKPVQRGPELWVVDESSFIGQRDMNRLMFLAEKAEARVMFVGDARQLSSPEAGKPFELGQKEGMEVARMTEIRRQKNEDLQSVVGDIVKRQNAKAFGKLSEMGRVVADEDKDKLFDGVAASYMRGDRKNTLIITPFNSDRTAINAKVRDALRDEGVLKGSDKAASILVNRGLTKAQMQHAKYYKNDDVVLFRRGYKSLEIPDNSYLRVTGIDRNNNVLTLKTDDGKEVLFSPKGKASMEVYRQEARGLATGDKIRITRSTSELKTGDMGVVTSIKGQDVTIDTGKKTVSFDMGANKHWDHSYAVTVHASQGLTVDKTIFHIHVPQTIDESDKKPLEVMAKVFGERSFYVGVSRSKHEVEIHTNHADGARRFICAEQDKSSSLEAVRELEGQRGHGKGGREM